MVLACFLGMLAMSATIWWKSVLGFSLYAFTKSSEPVSPLFVRLAKCTSMRGSCWSKSIDAHFSPFSGKNNPRILRAISGFRAGICCRFGFDILIRPDTVPPPSERNWFMWPWMRSFSAYRNILDRKVLPILSYSLASAIFWAIGCSCWARKFFVKLGNPVLVRP